ncbi:protein phosphatase 1 regulatory subunit 35, partial [Betta splendens]|uniref:Protein phosphatase 1 regulatory subunit 35 n=1 Tax=Betta splendens TaxID=158456 RepID=A0A6P7NCW2_BETSP
GVPPPSSPLPPSPHPAPVPLTTSSSLTHCPELDLSVVLSPAPKTGHAHIKTCQKSNRSPPKPHPRKQTGKKRNAKVCFVEPVAVRVTAEPHVAVSSDALCHEPFRGQRKSRGYHHVSRQSRSVEPPAAESIQDPGYLEKAEMNTTLALKAELQSVQGAEFNPQKAIKETLQRSEKTKNLINIRATEVVNVSRSRHLFTSLISVSVEQDELISQAVQERLLLAPSQHHDRTADGPSLLPFMTPGLFRQRPLPPDEEPVDSDPRPCTWPAHSTFDLYKRQRRWEATP